jgi:YHS domain-containing protein
MDSEGLRYRAGGHGMSRHSHTQTAIAPAEVLDPVCGMTIAPDDAVGHVDYKGQTYYFCNESCLDRFRATPDAFLGERQTVPMTAADMEREYTCPMDPEVARRGQVLARSAVWLLSRSMSHRSRRPSGRARCIPRLCETHRVPAQFVGWPSSHAW